MYLRLGSDEFRTYQREHRNDIPIPGAAYPLIDLFAGKDQWFALYAVDQQIDNETFCNEVKRGNFRLHLKGDRSISQDCITTDSKTDF